MNGYKRPIPTPNMVQPQRTVIAAQPIARQQLAEALLRRGGAGEGDGISPGVYQGREDFYGQALQNAQESAQRGPQDIGAQVGQALNTVGTAFMAGRNRNAGQSQRDTSNKVAMNALAAALRGEPLGPDAIDAIGSEWVDPAYKEIIGSIIGNQLSPEAAPDLVQAVGPDGQLTWVPKSQAAGMASALPKGPEAAPTRDILRDGFKVNQELQPDGTWKDIGQGPQFAPPDQMIYNGPAAPTPDELGRGEFAKQNATAQAKYFDSVATAGAQAQTRMGDIDQLTSLIEMTPQGAGQEYLNKGSAVLSRFGVDLGEYANVPAAQAFQSIVSRIAPTLRVSGSGATSDFEMQQFLASLPAIGNMQGGNRIIANNLKKISERSVQEAYIAAQVQGGDLTPAHGRKKILDLGPLNLDLPKFGGAPVGGPGGAPGGAPTVAAPAVGGNSDDPLNLFGPQ